MTATGRCSRCCPSSWPWPWTCVVFAILLSRLSGAQLSWRRVRSGALLAAVGFELLKLVGTFLIGRTTQNPLYATFGVMVGLLVWINFASQAAGLRRRPGPRREPYSLRPAAVGDSGAGRTTGIAWATEPVAAVAPGDYEAVPVEADDVGRRLVVPQVVAGRWRWGPGSVPPLPRWSPAAGRRGRAAEAPAGPPASRGRGPVAAVGAAAPGRAARRRRPSTTTAISSHHGRPRRRRRTRRTPQSAPVPASSPPCGGLRSARPRRPRAAPRRECRPVGPRRRCGSPRSAGRPRRCQASPSECSTVATRVRPPRVAAPTNVPRALVVQPVLTPIAPR